MLHHAAGEYVELPGWTEDLSECRSEAELPDAARDYLQFMAEFVGVPIALIGVGPGREQVIWTERRQRHGRQPRDRRLTARAPDGSAPALEQILVADPAHDPRRARPSRPRARRRRG